MKSAPILGLGATAVDKTWLNKMFEEAGLDPKRARQAARVVLERILRRDQGAVPAGRTSNLRGALVRDPMVSFNRIIGRGDGGLPFVDAEEGGLSPISLASAFTDAGIDPAVSTAYAKVVAAAFQPEDLYREVWKGLGKSGEVQLEELCSLDWTPLRSEFPDIRVLPSDQRSTEVVPIFSVTEASAAQKGADPLAGPPRRNSSAGHAKPGAGPLSPRRAASSGPRPGARNPSGPAKPAAGPSKAAPGGAKPPAGAHPAQRRRPTKPPKK